MRACIAMPTACSCQSLSTWCTMTNGARLHLKQSEDYSSIKVINSVISFCWTYCSYKLFCLWPLLCLYTFHSKSCTHLVCTLAMILSCFVFMRSISFLLQKQIRLLHSTWAEGDQFKASEPTVSNLKLCLYAWLGAYTYFTKIFWHHAWSIIGFDS